MMDVPFKKSIHVNTIIIQSFYNNPDFKGLEKYVKVRMDFRIGTFGLVIYLVHSYINENKKHFNKRSVPDDNWF